MIIRLKQFGYLLLISFVVGFFAYMMDNAFAQKAEENLEWGIKTPKKEFYPGEPILLTLNITNTGKQEEKIDFGADGIEAFSMEIIDNSGKTVRKGGKIRRFGLSTRGPLELTPGEIGQKPIVLNQWCSTLLSAGQYHVVCYVEYRLRSEATKMPDTEPPLFNAGPLHKIELGLDINIIKMDREEFEKILQQIFEKSLQLKFTSDRKEWQKELANQRTSQEMLAFAESDLAVPYQLHILRTGGDTWLKLDAINSLVRSNTLEGAKGLMEVITEGERGSMHIEDVKRHIIDAVYRLRETGKTDIINATEHFIAQYKRPAQAGEPID